MASISHDKKTGLRTIQFSDKDGRRRSIRLGKVSHKTAVEIRLKVEKLNAAAIAGAAADDETARWVAERGDVLAEKLANVGLMQSRARGSRHLGEYLDQYIRGRTDHKPNTARNIDQARRAMVAFFGADLPIEKINAADAERWRNGLRSQGYKPATVSSHVKRAKMMFQHAVDGELIQRNPFAKLKPGQQLDKSREVFVSQETIQAVIDAAPDAEWRLIIALARFGGLRCPSEVLALEWGWIDWARDRFTVFAPKLEHLPSGGKRIVPIFPELRPYLEEAFELAEPGAVPVISRYRSQDVNLRTHFLRIIRKAGVASWERLFHNLRSSRQTELTETFPVHVVASWLGNSARVATLHYLQTTEDHFKRAAKSGAAALQNPVQQPSAPFGTLSQESSEVFSDSELCESVHADANCCGVGEYPRQESNLQPTD
jgi:integrase